MSKKVKELLKFCFILDIILLVLVFIGIIEFDTWLAAILFEGCVLGLTILEG